jgi:hypothetical protein
MMPIFIVVSPVEDFLRQHGGDKREKKDDGDTAGDNRGGYHERRDDSHLIDKYAAEHRADRERDLKGADHQRRAGFVEGGAELNIHIWTHTGTAPNAKPQTMIIAMAAKLVLIRTVAIKTASARKIETLRKAW